MYSPYHDESDAHERWASHKCEEFEAAIKKVVPDEDYALGFAKAIAWAIVAGEDYSFMRDLRLDDDHALCYHAQQYKEYEKDVEEAFDNRCTELYLSANDR